MAAVLEAGMKPEKRTGILAWAGAILVLAKVPITLTVTLSVALGHILFVEKVDSSLIVPALAVFLIACGSAALNQVQEARIDARMERTRHRPIPSGRLSKESALFLVLCLFGAGFYLLASVETHTLTLLALGLTAVVWYNGVYIYLKKITAFAAVPGALVGAIPPVIGWVSAGGIYLDPTILGVAFFFFLWQIPHFWLLLLMYSDDYAAVGLPSLEKIFSLNQIGRITTIWIVAVAASGILLAVAAKAALPFSAGIFLACLWIAVRAFTLTRRLEKGVYKKLFISINVFAVLVMLFLILDACL